MPRISAARKFEGEDLDTMIGLAMCEHAGRDAFNRGDSRQVNPYRDAPLPAWAWDFGWRSEHFSQLNGVGLPMREAAQR